ncbi:hypothetical protein AYO38_07270 [bacterium SCGC AG-212-C10]|nr:hypothetical protein AYO38_07270 [bacterium SCGC AG-212-C10]
MTRHLVLIHGRGQEEHDAVALKQSWLETWSIGLAKSGLSIPIPEANIHFPYYGDTLAQLTAGAAEVAEIAVRGMPGDADEDEQEFIASVMREVQAKRGLPEPAEAPATRGADEPQSRAWFNNRIIQGGLEILDQHLPGGSAATMYLVTKDVYAYVQRDAVREAIDAGVRDAMALTGGEETVVVGHSLGTVVGYNALKRYGDDLGWRVPEYITVGSPLGAKSVRDSLRPVTKPTCLGAWFNAFDPDDVVAIQPLSHTRFPFSPAIENKDDVKNQTANQHGITGYLNDAVVAKRIHDALTR